MSKLRGARAKAANPSASLLNPPANTALQKSIAHHISTPSVAIGLAGVQGSAGSIGIQGTTTSDYQKAEELKRVRSFVERYVIERAALFRVSHESEDAWTAILDGKRMYAQIALASHTSWKETPER
jgi:hypothetical protein